MSTGMLRFQFVVTMVAMLVAVAVHAADGPDHGRGGRPNIIFLLTDDQRWDALGCFGTSVIETPELDRLASEGVRFTNAFVTTSICAVSRASILSGQYARRHGIDDFSKMFSDEALSQTYPALFREHGYYTGFIGKWGVGANELKNLTKASTIFDYWAGASHQSNYWHERTCRYVTDNGIDGKANNVCTCPADARGVAGCEVRIGRANLRDPVHLTTDIIPQKVAQFLDARDTQKPFCLSISFKAPHGPTCDFPPTLRKLYADDLMTLPATATLADADTLPVFLRASLESDRGRRWAMRRGRKQVLQENLRQYDRLITGVDRAVGRIRRLLAEHKLAENTVIVFTSDNGHFFGEHGLFGKWLMYEESIRVPLIIVDPRLPAHAVGRTCDAMALNIDFAPTMLDLAAIAVPQAMQGKSLVPLVHDPSAPLRDGWFYEHHFTLGAPRKIERSEGVRTARWKYIRYIDQRPICEQLFDLWSDPTERHDLAGDADYAHILDDLRGQWETFSVSLK